MNIWRFPLAVAVVLSTACAPAASSAESTDEKNSARGLSSRKTPKLDITVGSEVTDLGKKRPPVSAETPVYCVFHSSGYRERGKPLDQTPLPAEEMDHSIRRALAAKNYLPATAGHAPSVGVVYTWGAFNVAHDGASENQVIANVLDHAALAGGAKFAAELSKAIQEAILIGNSGSRTSGNVGGVHVTFAVAQDMAMMAGVADPVRRFVDRTPKNDFLFYQATSNNYYVIVSAYDYESLATPDKILLWRARLTVNAQGLSQLEAIPPLITVAAPFLGRDMAESEIFSKRQVPIGQGESGAPTMAEPEAAAKLPGKK